MQLLSIHSVKTKNTSLFTYRITIDKYKNVKLNVSLSFGEHLVCFDGPGYKSKKFSLLEGKHIIKFSSFQFLMQIVQFEVKLDQGYASFTGEMIPLSKVSVERNKAKDINYAGFSCDGDISHCAYSVATPTHSILKITFQTFIFVGPVSRECRFGGGSVFERHSEEKWKEIFLFCKRYINTNIFQWVSPRSVFSNSSKGLILLHAHKEYCSLGTHIQITSSECKMIKIIPCGVKWRIVPAPPVEHVIFPHAKNCTVVQISSGQFHSYENPVELPLLVGASQSYLKAYFNSELPLRDTKLCESLVYPACLPITLQIDHTQFEDRSAFYSIQAFLNNYYHFSSTIEQSHNFFGHESLTWWAPTQAVPYVLPHRTILLNLSVPDVVTNRTKLLNLSVAWGNRYDMKEHIIQGSLALELEFSIKRSMTEFVSWTNYFTNSWINFYVSATKFCVPDKLVHHMSRLVLDPDYITHFLRFNIQSNSKIGPLKFAQINPAYTLHTAVALFLRNPNKTTVGELSFVFESETRTLTDSVQDMKMKSYFPVYDFRKMVYKFSKQGDQAVLATTGTVKHFSLKTEIFDSEKSLRQFAQNVQNVVFFYWLRVEPLSKIVAIFKKFREAGIHVQAGKYHFIKLHHRTTKQVRKFSWKGASLFCDDIDGHLPRFFSRDEHDELTFLLKTSEYSFVLSSIFIDLRFVQSKMQSVSVNSIISACCFVDVHDCWAILALKSQNQQDSCEEKTV